ncbi:unannotated protein [freshwater metagenome]|uniref:Unannotated protein n=1 Tax=freshwater metagenome TaxID=449393 RepID=A0A6J7EK34_9ZZZZ|nr:hypothetical protein [Actinomycetota bacterium]
MAEGTVQYRVAFAKNDVVIEGPDDADVVLSAAAADAGLDPTVAFMQGRLKSAGPTGALFDLLKSGQVGPALARLGTR